MRRQILSLGFLFLGFFLALPATSHAQIELKEDMTQGDFALWLVEAIGAKTKLPPAAQGDDAITFMSELGFIPEGGWQKDDPITTELLTNLLEEEDQAEAANLSFEDLVDKVRDHVQAIFDERKLGVFRVLSATPSMPAV